MNREVERVYQIIYKLNLWIIPTVLTKLWVQSNNTPNKLFFKFTLYLTVLELNYFAKKQACNGNHKYIVTDKLGIKLTQQADDWNLKTK